MATKALKADYQGAIPEQVAEAMLKPQSEAVSEGCKSRGFRLLGREIIFQHADDPRHTAPDTPRPGQDQ